MKYLVADREWLKKQLKKAEEDAKRWPAWAWNVEIPHFAKREVAGR